MTPIKKMLPSIKNFKAFMCEKLKDQNLMFIISVSLGLEHVALIDSNIRI